jgi:hypothetical protein
LQTHCFSENIVEPGIEPVTNFILGGFNLKNISNAQQRERERERESECDVIVEESVPHMFTKL